MIALLLVLSAANGSEPFTSPSSPLPDSLRMVTALYFIGGMSQREVGDYIGVSETAVKKRLFNARRKLRGYVMDMANTMSHQRMPAEDVSARVIAELVSRPQPLLIKDHPVREIADQIEAALPDYEVIEGREVEEKKIYPSIQGPYFAGYGTGYHLDAGSMLRDTHDRCDTARNQRTAAAGALAYRRPGVQTRQGGRPAPEGVPSTGRRVCGRGCRSGPAPRDPRGSGTGSATTVGSITGWT